MVDDWHVTHELGDLPPAVWDFLKSQGLLRDDHPEALRRPRVLRLRALVRAREAVAAAARPAPPPSRCRTRSDPPSSCSTTALRSRRTTTCRGSRVARTCRASRSPAARGLRRRLDPGHRHRLQAAVAGPRGRRHPPQLLQALHHARAGRDGGGPRLPHVRPGQAPRATRPTSASAARSSRARRRASRSAAGTSRSTSRSRTGRSRARMCSCRSTSSSAARRWPARAGACSSSSCRSGRCISLPSNATGGAKAGVWATGAYARIRRPVQHAGRPLRGRLRGDRAHERPHLHHGRGALGDRRRDRRRREAVGAVGDAEVPLSPSSAAWWPTTRWTCTAARASASGPATTSAAATRPCRSPSRSRARTS